jgi:hypothetical protein
MQEMAGKRDASPSEVEALSQKAQWQVGQVVRQPCWLKVHRTSMVILRGCPTISSAHPKLFRGDTGRYGRLEGRTGRLEGRTRRLEGRTRRLEGRTRRLEGRTRWLEDRTRRLEGRTRWLEGRTRRLEGRTRWLEVRTRRLRHWRSWSCRYMEALPPADARLQRVP